MVRTCRVGDLDLLVLDDGLLRTSLDVVLDFPRAAAAALTGPDAAGTLWIPVNNPAFRRDGAVVLVDAGAGDTMQPTLGRLPANLAAAGVPPGAVTHVLLTHLHPDHANGLVGPDGAAVFPNAELLIAAPELAFWTGAGDAGESAAIGRMRARNHVNLAPYRARLRAMHGGEAVLGCTPIPAPGHTPGHTCWRIETGGAPLLAWGDVVHLAALQITHPEAGVTFDFDPGMARRSRGRILELAAAEEYVVAGAHIDAPGLGQVVRRGAGYGFAPL